MDLIGNNEWINRDSNHLIPTAFQTWSGFIRQSLKKYLLDRFFDVKGSHQGYRLKNISNFPIVYKIWKSIVGIDKM